MLRHRFEKKFVKRGPDECWIWHAAVRSGYGVMWVPALGRNEGAHRISWFLANGHWPAHGLWVLHRCDVRACVNPAHLFLGTVQDNNADMMAKGRHGYGFGEASRKSRLTEGQVRQLRKMSGTDRALAKRFGVGKTAINNARYGRSWRHLDSGDSGQ